MAPRLKLFLQLAVRDARDPLAHWQAVMPKSTAGLWPVQLHASGYDAETTISRVALFINPAPEPSAIVEPQPVIVLPLLGLPTFAHQWDPERPGAECWLPLWDEPCKLGDYISVAVRGRLQKLAVMCTNRAGLHR
jgi:hypothetical protein